MHRFFFIIILFLVQRAYSATYYVATTGSDANSGTIELPLASIQKAQELANAGDMVYIRGGNYQLTESDISKVESDLFACITYLDKSGTANQLIKYWAYPGEHPVFDFSAVRPANKRVVGIYIKGSYLHLKGIEMTGIQVTITTHTESYCIYSRGSHNIFENLSLHDNKGTGIRHYNGGYNLFLNCDAYRNHDDVSENQKGGNTDGFGCHPSAGGKGNVFRGCRSWFNSDDGFDCIRSSEAITFDSCYAFYNGYSTSFASLGDGNGFKAGGFAYDEASKIPDPVPSHTVRFSVAVRNKANGFYANHHLGGNKWYNNTAYQNSTNYNMVNRESPESDNINVPGYGHILKNNLGYKGRSKEIDNVDVSRCTLESNSFDIAVNLSDNDFLSLDQNLLIVDRNADGSLPETDFMRLAPNSDLIDKGVDIGFKYSGNSPDIGAFEFITIDNVAQFGTNNTISLKPNPVTNFLYTDIDDCSEVRIFDMKGKVYLPAFDRNRIDVAQLNNGLYMLRVIDGNKRVYTGKFIKK